MGNEREDAFNQLQIRIMEQGERKRLAHANIEGLQLTPGAATELGEVWDTIYSSVQAEIDSQWVKAILQTGDISPQTFIKIWNAKDELTRKVKEDAASSSSSLSDHGE